MQHFPHYHFSWAVMTKYPKIYKLIETKADKVKQSGRQDIANSPLLFNEFCHSLAMAPSELSKVQLRTPNY